MAEPLINGRAYDYADIQLTILNVQINGITAINYTESQDKPNNFGAGIYATSRGHATRDASGSLDLNMNEVEALREVAPLGNLLNLPAFDVVVVFGNVQNPRTHTVKNVEFTNDGVETATDDSAINRTFDFVASHVLYK